MPEAVAEDVVVVEDVAAESTAANEAPAIVAELGMEIERKEKEKKDER